MGAALKRRLAAAAAALLVVAAACGEDSPSPGVVGDGATTTVAPGGNASSTTGAGGAATTRKGVGGAAGAGGSGVAAPANADDGDLRDAAANGPGAFAGMLLAAGPADNLVIDVLVDQGVGVDDAALGSIRQALGSVSGKPVTTRGPISVAASGDVHNAEEIRALVAAHGKAQGGGSGVVHVVYLAGAFVEDSALGVAVRGDTFAVFPDQIARAASPLVSRSRIERAVVTHELGHLLGLVDLYLDTGRDDPEHPGHSTNSRSVMFWAVESDLVGQVLGGPPPVDFDAADQADLKRIREGARPG